MFYYLRLRQSWGRVFTSVYSGEATVGGGRLGLNPQYPSLMQFAKKPIRKDWGYPYIATSVDTLVIDTVM